MSPNKLVLGMILTLLPAVVGCGGEETPTEVQATAVHTALHDDYGSMIVVEWLQKREARSWVEYDFEGEWIRVREGVREPGYHKEQIIGIPFDTEVKVRVANDFGDGKLTTRTHILKTKDVPSAMPRPTLDVSEPDLWDPDSNFLLSSINQEDGGWSGGTYWKFIVDRKGRLVWVDRTPKDHWTIFMRQAVNGKDILWDEATWWASGFDLGAGSKIHRMKLDGTMVETTKTPGLHHSFTELPDETLVYGSADFYSEVLVEKKPNGNETVIWDCVDFYQDIGYSSGGYGCQSNTLYYDVPTDRYLYSFYTSNSVLEITRDGEVTKILGMLPGAWAFDPPESQFYFQHGVHYSEEGTLLVSSHQSYFDVQGVVREYEVDEANQTLREIWNQGIDGGIYSPTAGEVHRLGNGNTVHNYGASPVVQEVTPDGTVVWQIDFGGTKLIGRSTFIDDLYDFMP